MPCNMSSLDFYFLQPHMLLIHVKADLKVSPFWSRVKGTAPYPIRNYMKDIRITQM